MNGRREWMPSFAETARAGNRSRARRLLHMLPRRLYDELHGGLKRNVRRYAEIVNAALAGKAAPHENT